MDLQQVSSTGNACGEWKVTLQAQGLNADLVLTVDGRRHRQWTIDGTLALEAEGQAAPGTELKLALVASNHTHEFSIQMPKLVAHIHGDLPEKASSSQDRIPLSLSLEAPCQLRVPLDYQLTIDGTTQSTGRWMPGSTDATLTLPKLSAGSHTLQVTSKWKDQEVSQWTQEIQIDP